MPVVFEIHYKDGAVDKSTAWIENKYNEVAIPNPDKRSIDYTLFDPGRQVVKKVNFEKSFDELSAQAQKAENMIDRYDALIALRQIPLADKKELLIKCYSKEKFHLIKTEIIEQMTRDSTPESVKLFRESLKDTDANVRKSVLINVNPVPLILIDDFEKCLTDYSYLNIELALDNLCSSFPQNLDRYLEMTKNMTGWRGLNIRMKWLQIAIGNGKQEYLQELIGYTGPKYEFETRMNSLNVLKHLRYVDETTLSKRQVCSQALE